MAHHLKGFASSHFIDLDQMIADEMQDECAPLLFTLPFNDTQEATTSSTSSSDNSFIAMFKNMRISEQLDSAKPGFNSANMHLPLKQVIAMHAESDSTFGNAQTVGNLLDEREFWISAREIFSYFGHLLMILPCRESASYRLRQDH